MHMPASQHRWSGLFPTSYQTTVAGEETLHSGSAAAAVPSAVTNLQRDTQLTWPRLSNEAPGPPHPSGSRDPLPSSQAATVGLSLLCALEPLAQRARRKDGCGSAAKRAWVAAPPAPVPPMSNSLEAAATCASLTNSSRGSVAAGSRSCDVGSSEVCAVSIQSFASLMAFWYAVLRCGGADMHGTRRSTHAHARRTSWE